MPAKKNPLLSLRGAVIMLMTVLMMAFTSAETRATLMVKMAEESGVGRFYEDKSHCVHVEVVKLAHMQGDSKPDLLCRLAQARQPIPADPGYTTRARSPLSPRAPPHRPRAPPVLA